MAGEGKTVTVRIDGDELTFLLAPRDADAAVIGAAAVIDTCSPESPLGAAVSGKRTGDTVNYAVPGGRREWVTITNVEESQ